MEVVLTMPEDVIIKQEDDPRVFLLGNKDESKVSKHNKDPDILMYFIARVKV